MQKAFHCKSMFRAMRTLTKTPRNLDLYLVVDQRQMKVIDVDYSVKVDYWASRNNAHEYKVYATMIQMFNMDFVNNL